MMDQSMMMSSFELGFDPADIQKMKQATAEVAKTEGEQQ
jgi:hypothetical protein